MSYKDNGRRFNDDFRKMVVELYHSGQSVRNNKLTKRISEIHHESDKRYGAPKIHYLLVKEGVPG